MSEEDLEFYTLLFKWHSNYCKKQVDEDRNIDEDIWVLVETPDE